MPAGKETRANKAQAAAALAAAAVAPVAPPKKSKKNQVNTVLVAPVAAGAGAPAAAGAGGAAAALAAVMAAQPAAVAKAKALPGGKKSVVGTVTTTVAAGAGGAVAAAKPAGTKRKRSELGITVVDTAREVLRRVMATGKGMKAYFAKLIPGAKEAKQPEAVLRACGEEQVQSLLVADKVKEVAPAVMRQAAEEYMAKLPKATQKRLEAQPPAGMAKYAKSLRFLHLLHAEAEKLEAADVAGAAGSAEPEVDLQLYSSEEEPEEKGEGVSESDEGTDSDGESDGTDSESEEDTPRAAAAGAGAIPGEQRVTQKRGRGRREPQRERGMASAGEIELLTANQRKAGLALRADAVKGKPARYSLQESAEDTAVAASEKRFVEAVASALSAQENSVKGQKNGLATMGYPDYVHLAGPAAGDVAHPLRDMAQDDVAAVGVRVTALLVPQFNSKVATALAAAQAIGGFQMTMVGRALVEDGRLGVVQIGRLAVLFDKHIALVTVADVENMLHGVRARLIDMLHTAANALHYTVPTDITDHYEVKLVDILISMASTLASWGVSASLPVSAAQLFAIYVHRAVAMDTLQVLKRGTREFADMAADLEQRARNMNTADGTPVVMSKTSRPLLEELAAARRVRLAIGAREEARRTAATGAATAGGAAAARAGATGSGAGAGSSGATAGGGGHREEVALKVDTAAFAASELGKLQAAGVRLPHALQPEHARPIYPYGRGSTPCAVCGGAHSLRDCEEEYHTDLPWYFRPDNLAWGTALPDILQVPYGKDAKKPRWLFATKGASSAPFPDGPSGRGAPRRGAGRRMGGRRW